MIHDVWILGDEFLKNADNELKSLKQSALKEKQDSPPLYMIDFYNVHAIYNTAALVQFAATRMLNALTEKINQVHILPKFLIVVPDKDILYDIDLFAPNATQLMYELTRWFVRQINTIIRRKRVDLLAKKPGALLGYSTTIIFVRMIRRVGSFNELSRMSKAADLRPRFNDALNDVVAKISQRILTVNSCNAYEDFERGGHLLLSGFKAFWNEVDDLLDRYERSKVKLLPNPKKST